MEAGSESRLRSTLGVFGTAFRNRSLLLVELAWLAFNSAEWGVWLALMVWAYTYGGAAAVSLIVIVQLVPSHLHLALPRRDHRPGARRPGALHRPADHGRQHGGPGGGDGPGRAAVARLRPRADHEPGALRPAAGAGGAAARRRAHAARAHRRQRRLQLDGERQRAHRAGAHRRAARRRRPGAGDRRPRRLHAGRRLPRRRHPRAEAAWPSAARASR